MNALRGLLRGRRHRAPVTVPGEELHVGDRIEGLEILEMRRSNFTGAMHCLMADSSVRSVGRDEQVTVLRRTR